MNKIIEDGKKYLMSNYSPFDIVIEKGDGAKLYDKNGKEYIDFTAGVAVNSLGYADKDFVGTIVEQSMKLQHCSNLYWNQPSIELAKKLVENTGLSNVFYCNSGAEAVEGAVKIARKYGVEKKGQDSYEIIAMKNSFHGRTMGSLSVTIQPKYQGGFGPMLDGVKACGFNDIEDFKSLVTKKTCAVIMEVIQGEGGIKPAKLEFLKEVEKICTQKDILMIIDEVQSGIGRSGKLFAYQHYGIKPDLVAVAKGLGGGLPIGCVISGQKASGVFTPSSHGSTFGGNPIACSVGMLIIDRLLKKGLMEEVEEKSAFLLEKLEKVKESTGKIREIRGIGLMIGIEVGEDVKKIVSSCMEKGLLVVGAGSDTIRIVPPLVIGKDEISAGIEILEEVLTEG